MVSLNEKGLVELNLSDQHTINGGFWGAVAAGLIIAAGAEIISDWDNFERGLTGQPYKE